MNTPRHLYLARTDAPSLHAQRAFLMSADAAPAAGVLLVRAALADLLNVADAECSALPIGPCERDTHREVYPGSQEDALCAALVLLLDPDAEPAEADRVTGLVQAALCATARADHVSDDTPPPGALRDDWRHANCAPADLELTLTPQGTYKFTSEGIAIDYPAESTCGRFPCTPEAYGFTVICAGGNLTSWRREFTVQGVPVFMLISADGRHEFAPGSPLVMSVSTMDGSATVTWTQTADVDESSGYRFGPFDIEREDEMPAARAPARGTPEFTALVPRVANAFSATLAEWIGPARVREAAELNRTREPGVCHSHDHCDANMVMADAFAQVGVETCYGCPESGPGADERQTNSTDLWNDAWDMAREHEFAQIA